MRLHRRVRLPEGLGWTRDFEIVTDPELIRDLSSKVLALVKGEERSRHPLELAPPFIDLDRVAKLRFSFHREWQYDDVGLDQYVSALDETGRLADLDLHTLRLGQGVEALDASGDCIEDWPVFRCLSGEIAFDRKTYVLDDGEFYLIDSDYLGALDAYVDRLPTYGGALPDANALWTEGEYNEYAAARRRDLLLLDKKTVRVTNRTSPVEVCDLLSDKGDFIHVKRKLASSSLSHLFSQGYVSAELLVRSEDYRSKVLKKIRETIERAARKRRGVSPGLKRLAKGLALDGISPRKYRVVYAIIANWNGRSVVEAMPFFSKVNLRDDAEDLRAMGYKVALSRVPVVPPPTPAAPRVKAKRAAVPS
jgi:uncharacterized protein (TIGR04141 family)